MSNKKIVVQTKKELLEKVSKFSAIAQAKNAVTNAIMDAEKEFEVEATARMKEINRRKTSRRNTYLDYASRIMGYDSWSNFGKQFTSALIHLEKARATKAQVNATIKVILLRSAKAVLPGDKEIDATLQSLIATNPRLREKW